MITPVTDRSGAVERLLQLRDEFLVLLAISFQLLHAAPEQSDLCLEVRQLLILSLEPLASVSRGASRLLQPALTSSQHSTVVTVATTRFIFEDQIRHVILYDVYEEKVLSVLLRLFLNGNSSQNVKNANLYCHCR